MNTGNDGKKNAWVPHLGTFLLFAAIGAGAALGLRSLIGGGADAHAIHRGEAGEGRGEMDHSGHDPAGEEDGSDASPGGMDHSGHDMPGEGSGEAGGDGSSLYIDLGNESCPVMGGAVDGKTYTEWNGLLVGHCCPGCTEPLLEDPEQVLDDAGIEWREAAAAAERLRDASEDERAAVLEEVQKEWKVVSR